MKLIWLIYAGMCSNINCSQNAICKDGQCVCKDGYTRDGIKCKKGKCVYIYIFSDFYYNKSCISMQKVEVLTLA